MASQLLEGIAIRNPRTNRLLRSVKSKRKFILEGIVPVPDNLYISDKGRLNVLTNRTEANLERKGFRLINGKAYARNLYEENIPDTFDDYYIVRDVIRNSGFKGNVVVELSFQNNIVQTNDFNVADDVDNWWRQNSYWMLYQIESDKWSYYGVYNGAGTIDKIKITKYSIPTRPDRRQAFQHGVKNCLLKPIRETFEEMATKAKDKKDKLRFNKKVRQVEAYEERFKNGVPEEDLDEITEELGIAINITDILNDCYTMHRTKRKCAKVFNYINNRINHVEMALEKEPIYITRKEHRELFKNLKEGDYISNNSIHTPTNTYKTNEFIETQMKEWNKLQKIKSIDAVKFPELNEFIAHSLHWSVVKDYIENPLTITEFLTQLDMEKCYINFKENPYYNTFKFPEVPCFMTKVPKDFDTQKNVGFYQVRNIKINSPRLKEHADKLNIYNKDYTVYNSAELQFLKDNNTTFEVVAGAWNNKTTDITDIDFLLKLDLSHLIQQILNGDEEAYEYFEKITERKIIKNVPNLRMHLRTLKREAEEEGYVSPYKKLFGLWASVNYDTEVKLKGTKEFASYLIEKYPERVLYDAERQNILIRVAKEKVLHKSHITSYILTYARISTLQQLMLYTQDEVVRVNCDAIFIKKEYSNISIMKNFRTKEVEKRTNTGCDTYITYLSPKKFDLPAFEEYLLYDTINAQGAGGSGKTHKFITDRKLINPCYVASENKIIAEKIKEYNLKNYLTIAKLIGDDLNINNEKIKINTNYNNNTDILIIDESSKITNEQALRIRELYTDSLIIYCGDECQLQPIQVFGSVKVEPIDFSNFYRMDFLNNYRCKCPKLKKILDTLRFLIKSGASLQHINNYAIKALENNKGTDESYEPEEYIITSKKIYYREYTEKHKDKPKKWYILKNSNTGHKGDILIQETQPPNSELRHAFTAHSLQGITIKNKKLYIDKRQVFEREMFYTMLSRVEFLHQIVLIN